MSAPPSVRVVVPLPAAADAWLVALSDLDGTPVVIRALRAAASLGVPVVVPAPPDAAREVRRMVDGAGLTGVSVVDRVGTPPGSLAAEAAPDGPRDRPSTVLVHDPLCPLAPPGHLERVVAHATDGHAARAVVSVRPMTDTVKVLQGDRVTGTVDRARLRVLASPLALPWHVAERLPATATMGDPIEFVGEVRRVCEVEYLVAPPLARRVNDRTDLQIVLGLRDVEERDAAADRIPGRA